MRIKKFYVEFRIEFKKKVLMLGINYEKKSYYLWIHPIDAENARELPTVPISEMKNLEFQLEPEELDFAKHAIANHVPPTFILKYKA